MLYGYSGNILSVNSRFVDFNFIKNMFFKNLKGDKWDKNKAKGGICPGYPPPPPSCYLPEGGWGGGGQFFALPAGHLEDFPFRPLELIPCEIYHRVFLFGLQKSYKFYKKNT